MSYFIISFAFGGVAGALLLTVINQVIAFFRKPKRRAVARDKYGNPIYRNSKVYYRGEVCTLIWDSNQYSFFLKLEDQDTHRIVPNIPFTSYVAKECEINPG